MFDPNRLYSALLNTGLQIKDNALYQVIYQLIGAFKELAKLVANINISSGSGNNSSGNGSNIPGPPGLDGSDGIDGDAGPPGQSIQGQQGITGSVGPAGQGVYFVEDGIDGNDGFNIPNPGPQGQTGATGSSFDLFPRKTFQSRAIAENITEPFSDWYNGVDVYSAAGTQSNPGPDAAGTWLRNTSVATTGSSTGLRWHSGNTAQELTAGFSLPRIRFKIRTGSSIAACRYLIGLRLAATTPAADTENNIVLIRYSTNVPDGGFVGVTVDASGNVNTTATIIAIAASTIYELEVRYISSTEVRFTINGVSQTITHASQIPTAGITPHCTVTTLANVAKVFDFSVMYLDGL